VSRFDYFLGKLGVIAALVGMAAIGPAVLAYVIGVCCSLDLSVVKDTYPVLLASIAYGLLLTLSMGTFMLALSSLTQRSLYVGIAWAGTWIISGAVGSLLTTIHHEGVSHGLFEEFMTRWLAENPPPPGVRLYPYGPQVEWRAHADGKYGQRLAGISPDHEEEG
jgi:ABC-2 type transport system permease protein